MTSNMIEMTDPDDPMGMPIPFATIDDMLVALVADMSDRDTLNIVGSFEFTHVALGFGTLTVWGDRSYRLDFPRH